ncbi:hypothetical protein BO99DRAFT_342931 [Aspergillus violaceofuscus CBS 115571]|uniref:SUN domain-containing protein n=1 Tax=Aspergillus violaceofuscus (strain CBS 115571) TaxID=1450538 RepID=A0A2V5H368_ASPV1|nr:hypothetical protein BO99DRAFT_342931 [Aspergillus violaceofuscus CBS 115571]
MAGWTATQWIPWMTLMSTWIDGVAANQSPSICPTPDTLKLGAQLIQWPVCIETRWGLQRPEADAAAYILSQTPSVAAEAASVTVSASASSHEAQHRSDQELDTDSPLDNAKFLSFEDWKKQNLAKVGQSAENVGGSRRGGGVAQGKEDRRRPTGINNALDSLGDDAEIELDFGGFGADTTPEATRPAAWTAMVSSSTEPRGERIPGAGHEAGADGPAQGMPQAGVSRSKDAGTTCKERFNYASFDCAATVLKTNPECSGSSSVLIENKDSYMLNECRAKNKFLILELCDDILVDTVVLANYEFFSSIFHTFRVSVSDRYPAKLDQWRELGVYEARNTREVQAFAVENPLIWARYVKIEFLTHYGNEFFCPLSLIRIHGTTMLEEYKHDGEAGPADDDEEEISEESTVPAPMAPDSETTATAEEAPHPAAAEPVDSVPTSDPEEEACRQSGSDMDVPELRELLGLLDTCDDQEAPAPGAGPEVAAQPQPNRPVSNEASPSQAQDTVASGKGKEALSGESGEQKVTSAVGSTATDLSSASITAVNSETASASAVTEADNKSTVLPKDEPSSIAEPTRSSMTQPPSANPTTQESFFKSVHKRLQMLESNSSLSLQYIEEQSRILRDAFDKVEKRQLTKTSTFLEGLNVTVLNELKQVREQYDQVWKSVALEFEHQRIQYHQEIHSLSSQLGVLADELVFQKRVAVIQSMMILFCFGLVLFARGTASGYIEIPRVQNMVTRSYSLRSSSSPSPPYGSPLVSPTSTRATSSCRRTGGHRRNLSEDSQDELLSPTLAYSPPTPVSDALSSAEDEDPEQQRGSTLELPEVVPPAQRSRSSPPDLPREGSTTPGSEASPVEIVDDSPGR